MTDAQKYRYTQLHHSYFGGPDDGVIEFRQVKVVTTRKAHFCAAAYVQGGERYQIPAGSTAVSDTAKYDGTVGTCYMCLPCLDGWAKETKQ